MMKHWMSWGLAVLVFVGGAALFFFHPNYWGRVDEPLIRGIFINQLVTSIAAMVIFARDQEQRCRRLGIALAVGLLAAALLGSGATHLVIELQTLGMPMPHPARGVFADLLICFFAPGLMEFFADLLTSCFALGLVVIAWPRRGKLLWLGLAALWGGFMLVLRIVGLVISFM